MWRRHTLKLPLVMCKCNQSSSTIVFSECFNGHFDHCIVCYLCFKKFYGWTYDVWWLVAVSRCSRVCVNAVCGSVIPLLLIVIVLKRYNNGSALPHTTSWRPQNYGESTLNSVERQKQRVISVARCQRCCRPQYRFYGHFLEHFFLIRSEAFDVPRVSLKSRESRGWFFSDLWGVGHFWYYFHTGFGTTDCVFGTTPIWPTYHPYDTKSLIPTRTLE